MSTDYNKDKKPGLLSVDKSPLPAIPAWAARSTWLLIINVINSLLILVGIDLETIVGDLGYTFDQVSHGIQIGLTIVLTVWMWLERKAPSRALSLTGRKQV